MEGRWRALGDEGRDKKPGQRSSTEDWPEATTEDEALRGNLVDKPRIAGFLPQCGVYPKQGSASHLA